MGRRSLLQRVAAVSLLFTPQSVHALSIPNGDVTVTQKPGVGIPESKSSPSTTVAYRSLSLDLDEFGVQVPVAMWHPIEGDSSGTNQRLLAYNHRISVKKIGQMLAGWEFIPDFASKDFRLEPTIGSVADGSKMQMPSRGKVVLLAHGYLGSRFDLSHLAEALAQQGFICISPEYPESLSASYPREDGLDRSVITSRMLEKIKTDWNIDATSFGIVGHSLGCGTAVTTGDDTWTRVCIAGFPRTQNVPGPVLYVSSMNDGAVSPARFGGRAAIPSEFVQLEESKLSQLSEWPSRATLLFDRPDAPNHISFLSDGVNNAMIDLLSPLLPVAQALSIPVLDFDKYQVSRDSKETADVVIPLVSSYLKQHMR